MFIIEISGFPGSQNIQQKSAFCWMSKRPLPRCWTWFESATTRADARKDLSSDSALLLCIAAHFRYGEVVYFVVFVVVFVVVVVFGVLLANLNRSHGFNGNIRRKQL